MRCAKVILFFELPTLFCEKKLFAEEFILKQKQIDCRHGDIGIGQVEDGAEEIVVAVHEELQQARYAVPLKQREIEHIDDLAHHETGVMASELRHGEGSRFGEYEPVEGAVEDVAQRPGDDQRQADEYAFGCVSACPVKVHHEPTDGSHHRDPEDAQHQLSPVETAPRGDVHAESRPVVFDEAQLEPVREDDDRLVEVHVGLDPDFERLVCEEQQKDKERYSFRIHFVRALCASFGASFAFSFHFSFMHHAGMR